MDYSYAWIKFLECILHIAYKLKLQKTSVRGATETEKKRNKEQENRYKECSMAEHRYKSRQNCSRARNQ